MWPDKLRLMVARKVEPWSSTGCALGWRRTLKLALCNRSCRHRLCDEFKQHIVQYSTQEVGLQAGDDSCCIVYASKWVAWTFRSPAGRQAWQWPGHLGQFGSFTIFDNFWRGKFEDWPSLLIASLVWWVTPDGHIPWDCRLPMIFPLRTVEDHGNCHKKIHIYWHNIWYVTKISWDIPILDIHHIMIYPF